MSITKRVIQVTNWQTEDGKVFDTEVEAQRHQDECDLLHYLNGQDIYWREPDVDQILSAVIDWVNLNYTRAEK